MLLYYISDRSQFPGDEPTRRRHLLAKIGEAARCGVDFIQLREKDLAARELELLAREVLQTIHANQPAAGNRQQTTALLINTRTDIALAVDAGGVHLRSDDVTPPEVLAIWTGAGKADRPLIAVSCHSESDVVAAASNHADFAVFAPVFEKKDSPTVEPTGLDQLQAACRHNFPVLALGGVTIENARDCIEAGAAGIAGIRLFQQHSIRELVQRLRPGP